MKKTWNSWKERAIHEKKREVHGKKREIHKKVHEYVRNASNSWKRTWNSSNSVGNAFACTNTWEQMQFMKTTWNSWKKREIHENNVKFMKKTCNSWKKTWNSWKKCGIHGKNVKFMENNVEIMEKNVKFMENNVKFIKRNVQFMKKPWNSEKCIGILLSWSIFNVHFG